MHKFSVVSFAAAVAIAVTFCSFSQQASAQQKIGYVNSEKVLNELPEAKTAQSKLEGVVKGWQDELDKMSKALQAKYEDYQKQQSMMNDQTKQTKQKELVEEEQKINQYKQEKFGNQGELAVQREKMMKPIQEKVFMAIERVAKEQKLAFVLDKATDVPVLYADPQFDYTYKVIDNLKRGSK
ncbi:MAG TPA: OmpH family outer membrane protein [Bacteroidota bacterium]|nr:OmpH family outer membrane protein [Bacteroidota bacterium]